MAALEKKLKEFQKKSGNRNCFVCGQKVCGRRLCLIQRVLSILSLISSLWSVLDAVEFSRTSYFLSLHFSREFSHTIKHTTLGTWTKDEVENVTSGGNKVCIWSFGLRNRRLPSST